ncbi:MAG: TIGR03643 family protein [Halothece sp.]
MSQIKQETLTTEEINRIIEMAWEDEIPFEAIRTQYGLKEEQVIALMRKQLKHSSFKMWRRRVTGRKTKHWKKKQFNQFRLGLGDYRS